MTGSIAAWLTTLLVVVVCSDVATRYLFDFTLVSIQESQWHIFALVFLVGAASTLAADRHVRVDVVFNRLSPWARAWVDLAGTVVLLVPFCAMGIYLGWRYTAASFAVLESSPQPGGLPARYLLKASLPIAFTLLLIQGIGGALRALQVIQGTGRQGGKPPR
jgi:TRAP-type mannitol/chloroaromatic compound transport system permease small subunit